MVLYALQRRSAKNILFKTGQNIHFESISAQFHFISNNFLQVKYNKNYGSFSGTFLRLPVYCILQQITYNGNFESPAVAYCADFESPAVAYCADFESPAVAHCADFESPAVAYCAYF